MLPIVMGGAGHEDYLVAAFPHSFIHVDDFSSPRHLAAYLHVLDKNDTLYNSYFEWKGMVQSVNQRYWCRLCMMLHLADRENYVHWYPDYTQWWNGACSAGIGIINVRSSFYDFVAYFLLLSLVDHLVTRSLISPFVSVFKVLLCF